MATRHINSSAPTLSELYIEVRKGQEFFLYILVVGLVAGTAFGTHLDDSTVAIGQCFDGKAGFSASRSCAHTHLVLLIPNVA